MMVHVLIVVGLLVSAIQAIRAQRLLHSALWLVVTSVLVALEMYLLGAPEVAAIELSVGAGLVTVLFVFAINISGEEGLAGERPAPLIVPRPVAGILSLVSILLLIWMNLDILGVPVPAGEPLSIRSVLWENRMVDVLLQVVLIFAGVLGVLGLLAEKPAAEFQSAALRGAEPVHLSFSEEEPEPLPDHDVELEGVQQEPVPALAQEESR